MKNKYKPSLIPSEYLILKTIGVKDVFQGVKVLLEMCWNVLFNMILVLSVMEGRNEMKQNL